MSDTTRNRRFERKSRKNKANAPSGDVDGRSTGGRDASANARRSAGMRQHGATGKPRPVRRDGQSRNSKPNNNTSGREGGAGWIWGQHAVRAALANPSRTIHAVRGTENAVARLPLTDSHPVPTTADGSLMDRDFGPGHQGVAVKAAPLEWLPLETYMEMDADGIILVLDQVTDPHNVGAMLRLCSAFGVRALVMQNRHAPPLSGAVAKVAVGCLETIPVCTVTNIANTLNTAKNYGFMVTGLAGDTPISLAKGLSGLNKHMIVMGAEGPGLRPRVQSCCDQLVKIPMLSDDVDGEAESLNVSTAAAIALYEIRRTEE